MFLQTEKFEKLYLFRNILNFVSVFDYRHRHKNSIYKHTTYLKLSAFAHICEYVVCQIRLGITIAYKKVTSIEVTLFLIQQQVL